MATISNNFNSTWRKDNDKNLLIKSKKVLDGVLLQIMQTNNLQGVSLSKAMDSYNVNEDQRYEAVKNV